MLRTLIIGGSLALSFGLDAAPVVRPAYQVSTMAGTPGLAGSHDDDVHRATLNRPTWLDIVAEDEGHGGAGTKGDIYVVDRVNQVIRRISGGRVSTLHPLVGFFGRPLPPPDFGGPLGGGILIEPADAGCGGSQYDRGIWIAASGSQQIPLISFDGELANRDAAPLIGSGVAGAVDGEYFRAQFHTPTGLARSRFYPNGDAVTQRALYIADTDNHTVRRVRFGLSPEACPVPWIVETLAGSAGMAGATDDQGGAARFNQPRGLAVFAGSVYVADSGNHTIRRIDEHGLVTTVAGVAGVPGNDDGPARQAHLNIPSGIDFNEAGDLFITDTGNHTVRMLTRDGVLVTIAGLPGVAGYADGFGFEARFTGPVGIRALADGTILVADTSNQVIRLLTPVAAIRRRP
jgi:hypothetical protein